MKHQAGDTVPLALAAVTSADSATQGTEAALSAVLGRRLEDIAVGFEVWSEGLVYYCLIAVIDFSPTRIRAASARFPC